MKCKGLMMGKATMKKKFWRNNTINKREKATDRGHSVDGFQKHDE